MQLLYSITQIHTLGKVFGAICKKADAWALLNTVLLPFKCNTLNTIQTNNIDKWREICYNKENPYLFYKETIILLVQIATDISLNEGG